MALSPLKTPRRHVITKRSTQNVCTKLAYHAMNLPPFCLLFSAVNRVALKPATLWAAGSHHTALKMLFSRHQKH